MFATLIASIIGVLGLGNGEREEYFPRVIFESITTHQAQEWDNEQCTTRERTVILQYRDLLGCWHEERHPIASREFPLTRRRGPYRHLTVVDRGRVRRIRTRSVYHRARVYGAAGMNHE